MGDWLRSDEPWPSHTHPEWKRTLKLARESGWWFKPLSSHSFGVLACAPADGPSTGLCVIPIFSTGSGTENVARQTRQKIASCPHRQEPDVTLGLDRAEGLVASAERLLHAASACLQSIEMQEQALSLLDQAESELAAAEAETEFDIAEHRLLGAATRIRAEGLEVAFDAGPRTVAALAAEEADDRANEASDVAVGEALTNRGRHVRDRCSHVRSSVAAIRRRLVGEA